jgi:hypothetical protein
MAGTVPTQAQFTRTLDARPVHCGVWLAIVSARPRATHYNVQMSHPFELNFESVIGTYNALWDLSGEVVIDPRFGDHDNWLLTFRDGLRGMLARITSLDREYVALHRFQKTFPPDGNPNEWGIGCESHAGLIFFAMDSTIECFIFAVNAIGFAISKPDFCDITDPKALRQISPKNILGGGPSDKQNPRPGYQRHFPRLVAHFKANEPLLARVFEYHDVSKHRAAVSTGGTPGTLQIRDTPKLPGIGVSSVVHTVESLAHEFQKFLDDTLPIAIEETAAAFGYTVTKRSAGGG